MEIKMPYVTFLAMQNCITELENENEKLENDYYLLWNEKVDRLTKKLKDKEKAFVEKSDERTLDEIMDNIENMISKMPKREEADVKKISKKLQDDINQRNYYIVKDDLGLVSKKVYIGEENGEEDKDVQGNRNIEQR